MEGYGSHLPVLGLVCDYIDAVMGLEYGCGMESTPWMLDRLGNLTTVEVSQLWLDNVYLTLTEEQYDKWLPLKADTEMEFVVDRPYDVVLVDGSDPLSRVPCAMHCVNSNLCEVVVIHDTEAGGYKWENLVQPDGWLRADCNKEMPQTTVLSKSANLIGILHEEMHV